MQKTIIIKSKMNNNNIKDLDSQTSSLSNASNSQMDIWEKVFLSGKDDEAFLKKFGITKLKKR